MDDLEAQRQPLLQHNQEPQNVWGRVSEHLLNLFAMSASCVFLYEIYGLTEVKQGVISFVAYWVAFAVLLLFSLSMWATHKYVEWITTVSLRLHQWGWDEKLHRWFIASFTGNIAVCLVKLKSAEHLLIASAIAITIVAVISRVHRRKDPSGLTEGLTNCFIVCFLSYLEEVLVEHDEKMVLLAIISATTALMCLGCWLLPAPVGEEETQPQTQPQTQIPPGAQPPPEGPSSQIPSPEQQISRLTESLKLTNDALIALSEKYSAKFNELKAQIASLQKGLEIDPNNEGLKSGLSDTEASAMSKSPFVEIFDRPDLWVKLLVDPSTGMYLQQPDFVQMIQNVQKNPDMVNMYMNDQRMMAVLGVLSNNNMRTANPDETEGDFEGMNAAETESKILPERKQTKPEPMDTPDEENEAKEEKKKESLKQKELGTAAYKRKDFETAVEHYTRGLELNDEDISFITNRAAVYLETGKYEECIKECDRAVERGRELRSENKMIARALTKKATAFVKMANTSQDYDPAIEAFQKALTEQRNPDTLKKLNEAEKAKKDLEQQEYLDPKLADEEREKGNVFFKQQKYPEALSQYTEALRRNPKDPKIYSNRAVCYKQLGALPEGLKDADKCIELDPTFYRGYTRKGAIQFIMKEYDEALKTYREGLKHDQNNQELMDGVRRCVAQINKTNRGDHISADDLKERQAKAMLDPEIQNILSDPVMRQVLSDFQENPNAAQAHLKIPEVMEKIQKLVTAGIVQIK